MRGFIVMAMLFASLVDAAWNDYTRQRKLEPDADDPDSIEVSSAAGSIEVSDVGRYLIIVDDGRGEFRHTNVLGEVRGDSCIDRTPAKQLY